MQHDYGLTNIYIPRMLPCDKRTLLGMGCVGYKFPALHLCHIWVDKSINMKQDRPRLSWLGCASVCES